jgi:putative tricarboxylic transport membrane protein
MAVFLGVLVLHGIQPGPMMLINNQTEIYGLVWALTASCVIASFMGLLFVRPLARITRVPATVLVPVVLCVALVGSWAVDQSIGNVIVSCVFGVIGYAMSLYAFPRLPIVICLVLGKGIERNFQQSLMMSDGSWRIFFTRPVCLILIAILVIALFAKPLSGVVTRALGLRRMKGQPA